MECFIIENGAERKVDLEDLFFLIADKDGMIFRYFLKLVMNSDVNLAAALAFLPNETQEMVYRNVSVRSGGRLRKETKHAESFVIKYVQREKQKLMDFFGDFEKKSSGMIWMRRPSLFSKNIIWKETESKNKKEKRSPLESLEEYFDEALNSGKLDISYRSEKITMDDIRNAFQNRMNDLQKIRRLAINAKDLPAASLLFETGKLEELSIRAYFDGGWPSFLENCNSLTELTLYPNGLREFPSWIRSASSLRSLLIYYSEITSLPEWLGDLQSLTELSLSKNDKMETLPDSIGNLKNLETLFIFSSPIKSLPDSIGNLKNLKKLNLRNLLVEKMPDSIGDLQSLTELSLNLNKKLTALPDSIGNLQSLTEISLNLNKKLTVLPDSIGNLKNLKSLDIRYTQIEKLPDSIVNCAALEYVNIFGTKITSVPGFIKSVNCFKDNIVIEIIPQGHSISYRSFCNSYFKLAYIILAFNDKARREGLLALEEEMEPFADDIFKMGMRLVVDGTNAETIRDILRIKMEHEHDYYRKKLMEAALNGVLSIQAGDSKMLIAFMLASLVNIEYNPLEIACAKYLNGDIDALDNIDFSAAMLPEPEREEIRFIKRAVEVNEKARREGLLALEELLNHGGIDARDVFEYGIVLVIDGWDQADIKKILDNLLAHETDPVRKNIAQAKREAVMSINEGDNSRILIKKICAYFDDDITAEIKEIYDD